jgi:hypothetical protein
MEGTLMLAPNHELFNWEKSVIRVLKALNLSFLYGFSLQHF